MSTYKITNITDSLGKRDSKFNMETEIEYIDNRIKKTISLKPGENVYLTVDSLPLSVHRLRIKKVIDVVEMSPNELNKSVQTTKPKLVENNKPTKKPVQDKKKEVEVVVEKKTTVKKKSTDE